ncbi:hypothetical protein PSCFBP3800_04377 [Pseudomonas syringae group genomosp. 3]|uniref:Uncharacterized protein n=1 Tax=Pseudomonas syringae group genomosp. 3 TaxID=251701 RepID=A0A2K4WIG7_9PSED|nr:hypothetical protein CFBP6411_04241 [Pseudomonas syringae group genomosp. 3]SPF19833.1 hypothetical protein PSCFBP3800_04377 [Pseudomonas syringae group genomosp. 3]
MTLCCSIGVTRSGPELHALRDNPSDAENKKPRAFRLGVLVCSVADQWLTRLVPLTLMMRTRSPTRKISFS